MPVPRRPSRTSDDRVARWLVIGLTGGLAVGLLLAFPRAGDSVGAPVLSVLVCVLAGGLAGAVVGMIADSRRGWARPRATTAPVPPDPIRLEPPPAPPRLHDFAPPAAPRGEPAAEPGWYDDPAGEGRRLWDGDEWTPHVWRREREGERHGRRTRRRSATSRRRSRVPAR